VLSLSGYRTAMGPITPIHQSAGCDIGRAEGHIRLAVGPGLATQVQECYRAFVNECLQRHCTRALVVGTARIDEFQHLALRDALRSMALAGLPAEFRLALVAMTPNLIAIYDAVVIEGGRHGIEVRRFPSEEEAARWLAN
jgi:hypothetical protein